MFAYIYTTARFARLSEKTTIFFLVVVVVFCPRVLTMTWTSKWHGKSVVHSIISMADIGILGSVSHLPAEDIINSKTFTLWLHDDGAGGHSQGAQIPPFICSPEAWLRRSWLQQQEPSLILGSLSFKWFLKGSECKSNNKRTKTTTKVSTLVNLFGAYYNFYT